MSSTSSVNSDNFPRYILHEELGHGSFAKVYRATDSNGNQCALKWYMDPQEQPEARREIANLKKVQSAPHVLKYFTDFNWNGRAAIALEYIEDGDLSKQYENFNIDEIVDTAKQVLEALAFFHKEGLIHADLKFENILYIKDLHCVKIADFGSMRSVHDEPTHCLVTINYRALEIFLGGPYDTSIDMFSFGTFLFRLLTRKNLFTTSDLTDTPWGYLQIINLICVQCGYPSIEKIQALKYAEHFFKIINKEVRVVPIPVAFTPWEDMVEKGCRERGIGPLAISQFIDIIHRCFAPSRITAQEALNHCLFKNDIHFSIQMLTPLLDVPYILTLRKTDEQRTCVLATLSDLSALKDLLLNRHLYRDYVVTIRAATSVYQNTITIGSRGFLFKEVVRRRPCRTTL